MNSYLGSNPNRYLFALRKHKAKRAHNLDEQVNSRRRHVLPAIVEKEYPIYNTQKQSYFVKSPRVNMWNLFRRATQDHSADAHLVARGLGCLQTNIFPTTKGDPNLLNCVIRSCFWIMPLFGRCIAIILSVIQSLCSPSSALGLGLYSHRSFLHVAPLQWWNSITSTEIAKEPRLLRKRRRINYTFSNRRFWFKRARRDDFATGVFPMTLHWRWSLNRL
jgi:hypothetical protein